MKELGVAVIGAGNIGSLRAHLLARMPQVRFLAVADVVEERAQTLARQCQADLASDNIQEVIGHQAVDAVIIATSEQEHVAPALATVELRKPVLIEKPLAMTLPDADRILEAARGSGSEVLVGFTQRFRRRYLVTKDQVSRGVIGNVVSLFGKIYLNKMVAELVISRSPTTTPSVNTLTYLADLVLWYLEDKRPVKVYAQSGYFVFKKRYNAPDFTWVTVTFDDGTVANLGVSWLIPEKHPAYIATMELELFGTEGMLSVDDSHRDFMLVPGQRTHQLDMVPPIDIAFMGSSMPGDWALGEFWGPMRDETESFIAHLTTGRPTPVATGEQGRRALELTLAADRSASEGVPVELPLKEPV
ncbi:MAG: Gfo/Idh/MocA family protein [Dehalococcoidia bacterium]